MYIHPFLGGVLVTIGVEVIVILVMAFTAAIWRVKKYGDTR